MANLERTDYRGLPAQRGPMVLLEPMGNRGLMDCRARPVKTARTEQTARTALRAQMVEMD
jgi:hypothetical protein